MAKALTDRGELTKEAKAATKDAYAVLREQMGGASQAAIAVALGFTQGGVQKAAAGTAGRTVAEAIAAKLGLSLEAMVAKYGPASPELLRLADARYPNLQTAAALAQAELDAVLDDVFEERGQRDADPSVEEWLRTIRARFERAQRATKAGPGPRLDLGGKPEMPWKKK